MSSLLSNPNPSADNPTLIRLKSIQNVILHTNNRNNHHIFEPTSSHDESRNFLNAIDDLIDVLSDLRMQQDESDIDRAEFTLQSAMSKLEDELSHLLLRSSVPLDADLLNGSIHCVNLSFSSRDGCLIDGKFGDYNTGHGHVHERGGSISDQASVDLVAPDVISDVKDIVERMIQAGYEKECCQVYSKGRKDVLEDSLEILGVEKMSIEEVQRTEWSILDEKMKKWVQVMKIVVRVLLIGEKRLCDDIFNGYDDLIEEICFLEISKGCVIQLLSFGEAVAIGNRSPEKLFRIMDMYEALRQTFPLLQALFFNDSGEFVCSEAKLVLDALGDAAKGTFLEFEKAVKGEASKKPVHGGEIHPLARYVMNYVKLLVDYSDVLSSLLESDVKEGDNPHHESNHGEELEQMTPLACRLLSLINTLESNLEDKAKFYEDSALQCIFMMNNKLYIVQKVKDSELGRLLGDNWVKRRRGIIRKCATNYLRASWSRVLGCLRDDGMGSSSRSAMKAALKDRFKNFNANFEEIYRVQTGWKVPDSQLRTELRISISEMLIPAYRSFFGRFGWQIESGRHAGKYIKYTVEDLDGYLANLFEGTPRVIHHMRHKN